MSIDTTLAIVGIVLTVLLGVAGIFFAKKVRKSSQSQKVGKGAIGIQAGRDISTGNKNE